MGESGNHAEYLRALDEMPMDLFRLCHGKSRWPDFVISHMLFSLEEVNIVLYPHAGYSWPKWP